MYDLASAAHSVLTSSDPFRKVELAQLMAEDWRKGKIAKLGTIFPPNKPARPTRPTIRPPRDMPRRGKAHTETGRIALLHALAHIELNAVDLGCDIVARFTNQNLPESFYNDWIKVTQEEALHFTLLVERLKDFGRSYGDLPAHNGLWEAAENTSHDLLARLAVVPLVLEARGLDVTPPMIKNLRNINDEKTAKILERIYHDEIGHVRIGQHWFNWLAKRRNLTPGPTWQSLVRQYYKAPLTPPFNHVARKQAGLCLELYSPLAKT